MNFSARIFKPAMVALAAILFGLVGFVQQGMNVDRKAMGLTKMDPLENAPPVLAFTTVALGSFRGLIANALWIRLSDLQLDDKYFEMVQLCDWITKLQPRMVAVWQFQAWNMAYNISVKFKSSEDRWHWVERGIELLRDEGLRYNPNETKLYRDLSWLFQHKVGANLDDAHMTYKLHWAQEMQNVLGGRPNFKELLNPTTPEWKERVYKLTNIYKMDPKIVQKVDEEYGPFDWRLPDAHAVYWAEVGRIYARPEDQETLRRSVYQSMQQMGIRGGALDPTITNVTAENFILWPNLDRVGVISKSYETMIAEEKGNPHGLQQNMETAHKNFLKQAIYMLYEDDRMKEAEYWFKYLKKIYPQAFVGKEANISLEDYAFSQVNEDIGETDQNKIKAAILSMYDQEFYYLIRDNDANAENCRNMARKIYEHYKAKTLPANPDRLYIGTLHDLQQFALDKVLKELRPALAAKLRTKLGLPAAAPAPAPAPAATAQTGASNL